MEHNRLKYGGIDQYNIDCQLSLYMGWYKIKCQVVSLFLDLCMCQVFVITGDDIIT